MEDQRNKKAMTYISGSTARKLQTIPNDYDYQEEHQGRKRKISRATRRNRAKALSIDFRFMVFLVAAISMTLFVCINYINVQSSVTSNMKKAARLESELNNLRDENNATLVQLNSSVDLEYIYNVAVEELDMVYVNKNQVILYESIESDYVRQYQDVPDEDKSSLLSMLDAFIGE